MHASNAPATSHPRLLVRGTPMNGLRSLDDVRHAVNQSLRPIWERLLAGVEEAVHTEPIVPASILPRRHPDQSRHANPDYVVVEAACDRMRNAALACLITGDTRFRDDVIKQADTLFDPKRWPKWIDQAHEGRGMLADLRTGQLLRAFGYVYDWLSPALDSSTRDWFIEHLDKRGIQPYLTDVANGVGWSRLDRIMNWGTCIVGGAGIAGMALTNEHPRAGELVDRADRLMGAYLNELGPDGEFNESVGYSGSLKFPVEFYATLRYHTDGRVNRLDEPALARFSRWYLHMCLPPGRTAALGDGGLASPPAGIVLAALAAANQDPICQWAYHQWYADPSRGVSALELLIYDPAIESQSPEGVLPRGRAFLAHGATWSSRADWNPRTTPSITYGKAGRCVEIHGHHDVGQVCIDGMGQRLIVDLGVTGGNYPADFFGPNRWRYYMAGVSGHNLLTFDDTEMRTGTEDAATVIASMFDDNVGGAWIADLTGVWDEVTMVRRTMIHCLPDTIVVLDEATTPKPRAMRIRWHTIDRCTPDEQGRFIVRGQDVALAGQMVRLDGPLPTFDRGEHAFQPPFDRNRLGELIVQANESYVQAGFTDDRCRLLTVFRVIPGSSTSVPQWDQSPEGLTHPSPNPVWVIPTADGLEVRSDQGRWIRVTAGKVIQMGNT